MLWIGFRGAGGRACARRRRPPGWRSARAFLLGFRIALNIADSGVIDVGYAGVIGADHITHGQTDLGRTRSPTTIRFGDTYGPFNYYAYVPFELALPWSGSWDDLPAAHAAAIFFDLATVAGLFVLGRRLRPAPTVRGSASSSPSPGPPTRSPTTRSSRTRTTPWSRRCSSGRWSSSPRRARGALLALATMAKFAPLALAPLFAAGERGLSTAAARRPAPRSPAAAPGPLLARLRLAVVALMLALPAIDPGLATFYDRTVKSQIDRTSPFSIWGQDDSLEWLQTVVKALRRRARARWSPSSPAAAPCPRSRRSPPPS